MMVQMCPHRLFLTLLVVSIPASAQDFSDLFSGTITGDTYLFVGDDLELNCSLYDSFLPIYNASMITFKFQHQAQGKWKCIPQNHVKVVSNNVAMLFIQNVTSENVGPYGCYVGSTNCTDGDNSNVKLVSSSDDVFVEYAPHNVTHFQCEVYNWGDYMICAWQHPVNYLHWSHIEVTTIYMISGHDFAYKCTAPSKNNCTWNKEDVHLGNNYYIQTTVKTINNATASEVFVENTSAIVKPAPVQNFSIAVSKENSSCLILSWTHPDKHNKKEYRIKHENEILLNVTVTNITTCGYLPYTRHNFSVQCYPIELYSGYWSEPVYASFLTPMTAPVSGPQAKNGSFMTTDCVGGSRSVTLIWQEVEAAERNGLIDHYLIKVNNITITNVSADVNSANVLLPCYSSSQVEMFARNEGGYSVKPTVFYIPPVTVTVPVKLQETFSMNMTANCDHSKNSCTYRSIWQVSNEARDMNYTIYWCTGSPGKPCKGQLHWSDTITGANTYYDVHLQDSDVEKYIFGISVTYSDTGASSGIFWTKCLFSHNPFTSHPQTVEDLRVQSGVEKADIFWSRMPCTYQSLTKVTGYKIKWCEIGSCKNTAGISSVDVPATASMYTLSALTAQVKYNVTVQPVSYQDVGDEVKPWVEVIPSASENKGSSTIVIVLCVVGGFVILAGAGAVLYRTCKKRRVRSKALVPENFLPLAGAEPRAVLYTSSQATVRLLPAQSSNSVDPPDSPQGIHSQDMSTNLHNRQQSSSDPELLPSHSASAQSYHCITHQQTPSDPELLPPHSTSAQSYNYIMPTPPDLMPGLRDEHRNQENRMFPTSASGTDQMSSSPFSQSPDIIHLDLGSVSSDSRSLDSYHHFANCPPCSSPERKGVFSQDERTDQQLLLSGSGSLPSYQHVTYCGSDQPCVSSAIHHVDHQHHSLPSNPGSLQTDLSSMCDTVIPLSQQTVSHLQYDNERSSNRAVDHNPGIETGGNVNSHGPRPALAPAEPDTVATLTPTVSAQQGRTTVDVEPSFEVGTEVSASPSETSLSGESIMLSHMQGSNDYVPLTFEAGQRPTETLGDSDFSSGSSAVPTEYIHMTFHS